MVSFCELCGKQTEGRRKVMIEKTVFNVCLSCSKRGKPVESMDTGRKNIPIKSTKIGTPSTIASHARNISVQRQRTPPRIKPAPVKKISLIDELILDPEFPAIIRNARNKKELTHDQLGQKINEKVTLLRKIETGSIKPDEILAKKLERFLGIKLFIKPNDESEE